MSEKVVVTVNEGKVRGFKSRSAFSGVEYCSFLGVPYGQPNYNHARFRDPLEVKPWSGTFDATVEKKGCLAWSLLTNSITGHEDCLYNNIYTMQIPTSKDDPLKPVIVNIHPGGYFHGAPDPQYYGSPEYIIHHDVVYVTIAFRMHILGFLNLDMPECLGNQGIKDILLSLKWISRNIANFGGDPGNVTLLGCSSGAVILHYILLSPLARDLYHKAVLLGLYAFCPVTVTRESQLCLAYDLACQLGYKGPIEDKRKLLRFFKKIKMEMLISMRVEHRFNAGTIPVFPASPFMPSPDTGESAVLSKSIRSLVPSINRVPIIVGFSEREGMMAIPYFNGMEKSEAVKLFYSSYRQNKWGWAANLTDDQVDLIRKQIDTFYLDGKSIEEASESDICDILTDAALSDLHETLVDVISKDLPSSVYVYKFKYDGRLCGMKNIFQAKMKNPLNGTFHAAEYSHWACTLKHIGRIMESLTSEEREIIETFTSLITTFSKTGNPNYEGLPVQWKPSTPEQPSYLSIDKNVEAKDELINGKKTQFWHDIKKQFKKE